jgi:hypothetical protein
MGKPFGAAAEQIAATVRGSEVTNRTTYFFYGESGSVLRTQCHAKKETGKLTHAHPWLGVSLGRLRPLVLPEVLKPTVTVSVRFAGGANDGGGRAGTPHATRWALSHCRRIRDEYLIVDSGKLAGTGAHSYSDGQTAARQPILDRRQARLA